MAKQTSKHADKFIWYDLMVPDVKAAEAFYTKVVGWKAEDSGMPGMSYTILKAGDTMVGGMMGMPQGATNGGPPPMWSGYIYSSDVDAETKKVKKLGGTVCKEPGDIPGVGRFSVVADPGGAIFNLFKPSNTETPKEVPNNAPGQIGWRELHAEDGKKAFDFYSNLCGWTRKDAMDMGDMGVYQTFAAGGDDAVGGMMTKMKEEPRSSWLYYFNVEAIDAGVQRVKDAGGQIVNGPMEVPGNLWIVNGIDPQGVMFALLAPRR